MLGLVLFALLATSGPTGTGISTPGLDSRAPAAQTREQVSALPDPSAGQPDAPNRRNDAR